MDRILLQNLWRPQTYLVVVSLLQRATWFRNPYKTIRANPTKRMKAKRKIKTKNKTKEKTNTIQNKWTKKSTKSIMKQLEKDVDKKKYKNEHNDRDKVIGHDEDKLQDEINETP